MIQCDNGLLKCDLRREDARNMSAVRFERSPLQRAADFAPDRCRDRKSDFSSPIRGLDPNDSMIDPDDASQNRVTS